MHRLIVSILTGIILIGCAAPLTAKAGLFDDLANTLVDETTKAIEESIVEATNPVKVQVKSPVKTKAKLAETSVLDEGHVWEAIRLQWGSVIRNENIPVDIKKKDVTCDGRIDYVASHLSYVNPDGPFFEVILVTDHGGEVYNEAFSLSLNGDRDQHGLCVMEGAEPDIDVEFLDWTPELIESEIGADVCNVSIDINDGMCDIPRYFWLNKAQQEDDRLLFFRN